jgi:hypothetical protein
MVAERAQLLLRQVLVRAPQWLLVVEELNSQVLKTMARYRLQVYI